MIAPAKDAAIEALFEIEGEAALEVSDRGPSSASCWCGTIAEMAARV